VGMSVRTVHREKLCGLKDATVGLSFPALREDICALGVTA